MKKRVMLIAGCSHASGSEIDGTQDSLYNREHSFGGQLAKKLGYESINIGSVASTNTTIARSVIEWVSENYNPDIMELFVLIAWTESTRIEIPSPERIINYHTWNASTPWYSESDTTFYRINLGFDGGTTDEKKLYPVYHRFIADNLLYLEIYSVNLILQLQYFLKSKNLDYLMCSTMNMVGESPQLKSYITQIDQSKYMNFYDHSQSFYWLYKKLGHINKLAKYWHHGIEPHTLYAEKLHDFITNPHESE